MANQSNSKEKAKAPRITNEQLKEIVGFFYDNDEDYDLTIETFHNKWGNEYRIDETKLNSWIRIYKEGGTILREKSLLTLYVFEILRKYSSPQNPMNEIQIKEKIKKEHPAFADIKDEDRKTIPRHANGLAHALKDLIVKKDTLKNAASLWYYNRDSAVEYGVLTQPDTERNFAPKSDFFLGEAAFLVDMIKDSRIISSKCTDALIRKLVKAIDEVERENLVLPKDDHENSDPISKKSDNKRYLEFNDVIEAAIKNATKVRIENFEENEFVVTPIRIFHNAEEDKYCFLGIDENCQRKNYLFEDISYVENLTEAGDYPDGFDVDNLQEAETFKLNKSIALDTLFINMKEIHCAIKKSKYVSFVYLSLKVRRTKTGRTIYYYTQSPTKTLAPLKTLYKDGKPYLITVDPKNDYKPEFFRIDLMQDIRSHGNVDFMDRCDVRKNQECEDHHPYPSLLSQKFTEITAGFAIHEDHIDRVIDAFGNKAKYYGNKKGGELGGHNVNKLSKTFADLNFSTHLGLDHNETYCMFTVKTTLEEMKRFGMENADVVECYFGKEIQDQIREEMKALAGKVVKRYSKETEWTLEEFDNKERWKEN